MALNLGNHWLDANGRTYRRDDGRSSLGRAVAPGDTVELQLTVTAPDEPGLYTLEVDVVQESVSWFAARGSPTFRTRVDVAPSETQAVQTEPRQAAVAAKMEMYCLPRRTVERLVAENGGDLLAAVEHHSCGEEYENYQYFVGKRQATPVPYRLARPFTRAGRLVLDRLKEQLRR